MFVNNYYWFQEAYFQKDAEFVLTDFEGNDVVLNDLRKSLDAAPGRSMAYAKCKALSHSTSNFEDIVGVYFGTGRTAPTASDFTIESPITAGLSIVKQNVGGYGAITLRNEAGERTAMASYEVKNTTDEAITITEVGLFGGVWASTTPAYRLVLFERQVLSTPIILPAGSSKIITYKLPMN